MAKPIKLTIPTVISILFFLCFSLFSSGEAHDFSRKLSRESIGMKKEKLTHLHFYFHDVIGGKNATAVRVAEAPMTNTSATGFGAVVMTDDLLTLKPEPNSTEVGRAQGIYALASQKEVGLLMVYNFVFSQGKYNGSTLSILGRNKIKLSIREMPVVGGSGVFRFARGYALAHPIRFNPTTFDDLVEYNVYVLHY